MARQLDLFSASRTTEYRNTHPSVTRRLRGSGSGVKRIDRVVNRTNGRQAMRAKARALASGGRNAISARRNVFAGRTFRVVKGSAVRSSTGHSGG